MGQVLLVLLLTRSFAFADDIVLDEFPCGSLGNLGSSCWVKVSKEPNTFDCLFNSGSPEGEFFGKRENGQIKEIGFLKIGGKVHKLKETKYIRDKVGKQSISFSDGAVTADVTYSPIKGPNPGGSDSEVTPYDTSITVKVGTKSKTYSNKTGSCGS